ncbi:MULTISPECIES: hypothetical protein [unclassified Flavobacterium]|uniref:hypothetical protein n=1 Tax=unclassified Flavobacterium TaxID=196869 RepID=UPI0012929ABB|nr:MULTISPECIES: hypothetical protein [unclassified Flavobacterium]MQP53581.1 hypothetical protein [Flavobacterium sp. LMO9]MQP63535.1 hypothetical protein [Flavobacterium sp. LMO6]
MKKRISAELISIAHRILKLKNHSETLQLQQEAKNLYDQLTILRFYEENFELVKNEISQEVLEEKLEGKPTEVFNAPIDVVVENIEVENEVEIDAQVFEAPIEVEKVIVAELVVEDDEEEITPVVEEKVEEIKAEIPSEPESGVIGTQAKQISFEDMLVHDYTELDFVKVEDVPVEVEKASETFFEAVEPVTEEIKVEIQSEPVAAETIAPLEVEVKTTFEKVQKEDKISSLNDRLNKIISFGLNDRIGFEKKLFAGSSDDFNRVISQLNTFDSFDEARSFVQDFVKPDYNNWEGNEEFEARFMEIVEKKFS